jgi:putative N6-adenine-specific DNA methylase
VAERYLAICAEGLQGVVTDELRHLGATDIADRYHAVHFVASPSTLMRIALKHSTASRLLKIMADFRAETLNDVAVRLSRAKFHEWFAPHTGYMVEGIAGDRGPGAPSSNDLSKTVRLALEKVFERKGLPKPRVELGDPRVVLVAYYHAGHFTLSLDVSGKSLHKRGYRLDTHPAPIKENMAAGLLRLVGYDGTQTFFDPMCGSGTIAVEAAFMALHKAPLIHRRKGDFGFEWLSDFDRDLWREAQDEVRRERLTEPPAPLFAADIDERYVAAARQNALRARVEKHIQFMTRSFLEHDAPAPEGILVANLPYGTRIETQGSDLKQFYIEVGNTLKRRYAGWTAGLLVAEESDHKFIGLRPKKKFKLLNGSIPCRFLVFELY